MSDATKQEKDSVDQVSLLERVRAFVRALVDDQAEPPAISFALAYVATELGLAVANNPLGVFPVVLSAVSQATTSSSNSADEDVPGVVSELRLPTSTTVH